MFNRQHAFLDIGIAASVVLAIAFVVYGLRIASAGESLDFSKEKQALALAESRPSSPGKDKVLLAIGRHGVETQEHAKEILEAQGNVLVGAGLGFALVSALSIVARRKYAMHKS